MGAAASIPPRGERALRLAFVGRQQSLSYEPRRRNAMAAHTTATRDEARAAREKLREREAELPN
jgi:hypothetical protein